MTVFNYSLLANTHTTILELVVYEIVGAAEIVYFGTLFSIFSNEVAKDSFNYLIFYVLVQISLRL
jgi:uncharacterized membrane protein YuzA (DUF378 family)